MNRSYIPNGQPTVYYRGRYWLPTVWVCYIGGQRTVWRFRHAPHCVFTPPCQFPFPNH